MGKNGAKIYEHSVLPKPQTLAGQRQGLSYIEDFEVLEAKDIIDKQFIDITGKPFEMRVAGYYLALKIYVRPEELKVVDTDDGKKVTIWMPPQYAEMDKYHSCAALVCGVGPQAYQDKERFPGGPFCRVGDWVAIPRQNAFVLNYRNVPLALIPDDAVLAVINDPTDVTSINQKALI